MEFETESRAFVHLRDYSRNGVRGIIILLNCYFKLKVACSEGNGGLIFPLCTVILPNQYTIHGSGRVNSGIILLTLALARRIGWIILAHGLGGLA